MGARVAERSPGRDAEWHDVVQRYFPHHRIGELSGDHHWPHIYHHQNGSDNRGCLGGSVQQGPMHCRAAETKPLVREEKSGVLVDRTQTVAATFRIHAPILHVFLNPFALNFILTFVHIFCESFQFSMSSQFHEALAVDPYRNPFDCAARIWAAGGQRPKERFEGRCKPGAHQCNRYRPPKPICDGPRTATTFRSGKIRSSRRSSSSLRKILR